MANWYNRGKVQLGGGSTLYLSDTIKVALVGTTYTFNKDHNTLSDIYSEVSGGSYARQTLASKTVTQDDTNDRVAFDAADITFTSLTFSNIGAAIVYKDTGTPSTSMLLWYCDFTAISPSAADVAVQWSASGIAHLT